MHTCAFLSFWDALHLMVALFAVYLNTDLFIRGYLYPQISTTRA